MKEFEDTHFILIKNMQFKDVLCLILSIVYVCKTGVLRTKLLLRAHCVLNLSPDI